MSLFTHVLAVYLLAASMMVLLNAYVFVLLQIVMVPYLAYL